MKGGNAKKIIKPRTSAQYLSELLTLTQALRATVYPRRKETRGTMRKNLTTEFSILIAALVVFAMASLAVPQA